MTVNTTSITSGPYQGNGVANSFSYGFKVQTKNDLKVYETDSSGIQSLLNVDTDYTVNGVNVDGGGTIVRNAGPLPSGWQWYIRSSYTPTQDIAFESQGAFFPELHEQAMDKMTFLIQQLQEVFNRTARYPEEYADGDSGALLPIPEANKLIRWRADLLGFENIDLGAINPDVVVISDYVKKINTFADLANTPASLEEVVYLIQHTSGDVGGDFFVGISSAGLTPDSGLISSSTTPGVFFKRINFSFVTPEMFGAGLNTSPSDDAPTRAALLHPLPCRLSRRYNLSSVASPPDGKVIYGINKQTTGLVATSDFSIPGAASSVLEVVSNCNYSNFTVDANNANGGGAKRLNCCPVGPNVKNFHVRDVDVYNSTGYGHVTFGSESDPQVTGYYENCHGYNCQVPFEQIGALDVTLVKCTAEGVAGRTLELFHPYGGSKNVTYISCRAWGVSGAGINILTTNGHPVGPIRFIDSSIDIAGAVSAINVEKATGADTSVDLQITGGSYKSALGSALNLNTNGKFKFLSGAKFQGGEACNMPPFAAQVEFNGAEVLTAKASNTQQSIALVVNSAEVKVVGGRVEATNSGSGGSLAIMGLANVSEQTSLIPPVGGNIVFVAHSAGVINLQADGANGFVNISVPVNTSDVNKIILSYSVVNTSDAYPASNSSSWFLLDPANIRIRFLGINNPSMKISYDIKIIQ